MLPTCLIFNVAERILSSAWSVNMSNPLLNSVYLGSDPRRERFREAKQRVFSARGEQTATADELGQALHVLGSIVTDAARPVAPDQQELSYMLIGRGEAYPLKVGINTVGRFSSNNVNIRDINVSRRHCVILIHMNGRAELHDTASLNGTHLNGDRLTEPEFLYSGDRIRVGTQELTFLSLNQFHVRRRTRHESHDTILE